MIAKVGKAPDTLTRVPEMMDIPPNLQSDTSKMEKGIIMERIIRNKVRCKKCGEIIESKNRHDFITCKCGAVSVDGGHDYLKRSGNYDDWEELSECENI